MTIVRQLWRLSVCRVPTEPARSVAPGPFLAVVRRTNEWTIVCEAGGEPNDAVIEPGWRAFVLEGPFSFDEVGVLASVLEPLARANVPIFAISTFETDVVLVKEGDADRATSALLLAGHRVTVGTTPP